MFLGCDILWVDSENKNFLGGTKMIIKGSCSYTYNFETEIKMDRTDFNNLTQTEQNQLIIDGLDPQSLSLIEVEIDEELEMEELTWNIVKIVDTKPTQKN